MKCISDENRLNLENTIHVVIIVVEHCPVLMSRLSTSPVLPNSYSSISRRKIIPSMA